MNLTKLALTEGVRLLNGEILDSVLQINPTRVCVLLKTNDKKIFVRLEIPFEDFTEGDKFRKSLIEIHG